MDVSLFVFQTTRKAEFLSGKTQHEAQHVEVLYRARVVTKSVKKQTQTTSGRDATNAKTTTLNTALLTARSSEFQLTSRSDSQLMLRHRANMTSRSDSELVSRQPNSARKPQQEAAFTYLSYDEDDDDDYFVDDENKLSDDVSIAASQGVTSDERNSDVDASKPAKFVTEVSQQLSQFYYCS